MTMTRSNKVPDPTIDLAVYMERLDTYIATQSKLNETLCNRMERITDDLDELKEWRTKFYGAKALGLLVGILFAHAAVVMGAVVALVNLFRD